MPGSLEPLDVAVQIPYHFRCPISLELMRDPVTVCTGQTYDRASIESWVATGNTTCPVTRAPLSDFILIPNHTLRRLIQDWCVANRSLGVERIVPEVLLPIVFAGPESNENDELTHESLALLVMFPLDEAHCEFVASETDRVAFLSFLLSHSCIEVRVNAAALIEMVVAGTRSLENRILIGNADGVLEGITRILNHPLAYPRALKVGIKALFALCLVKQNRHMAVSAGAVEALIDKLADFEKCDAERALATVELLCRIPAGRSAFAEHALTVPLLVKIILKISDRATEYATGALVSLCSASEQLQRDAVAAGVVTQLLLLVQSDCTERAKRKAQLLLKLLRDSWPEDSIANSDDFACSDVAPF
uniref:U-box domain-containing protein n=1 Tax=Nelumbo nucifera TaxID=4432 RepID=A0A822XN91_NELNU|nr:TPA_asm: hypothetical protein HUJ06_022975 [Nelumbo nucifera]